jgi:histone deacetylase 1/2
MGRISYFYDPEIGNYQYAPGHPMKPHRIRMTHSLLVNYELYKHMDVYAPVPATFEDLTRFHSDDYIDFLRCVDRSNAENRQREVYKYNVVEDCPVFEGLYDYCRSTAGASLQGAAHINEGECDIAINWSGGLHHAKRREASGFCYVNDIVLGILELLRYHERIMYIDIDIHHGDGVEEAFYCTDRVMTVSFHKHGEFFPGTGALEDIGLDGGRGYSVNVPLRDGIDDESYVLIFQPVVSAAVEKFRPEAIVLQCGADSLAGDRLGCFNLTHVGHASCVEFVKKMGIPMLVLGGGGYTMANVSRAWTYETAILTGVDIPTELPYTEYFDHFHPNYTIEVLPMNAENRNTKEYLNALREKIVEHLREIEPRPSVENRRIMRSTLDNLLDSDEDEEMWRRLKERRILREEEHCEDYRNYDLDEDQINA